MSSSESFNVFLSTNKTDEGFPTKMEEMSFPSFRSNPLFCEHDGSSPQSEFAVQSVEALRWKKGIHFYFEVSIESLHDKGCIAIGLAKKGFKKQGSLPGWVLGSYGYHSDDGSFFAESGNKAKINKFGDSYGTGDTIGCGVDENGNIYYTLNGKKLQDTHIKLSKASYFPTVGIDHEGKFTVNLGSSPFLYDTPEWDRLRRENERAGFFSDLQFSTFMCTDKPFYRPGETVYFRGFILNSQNNKPLGLKQCKAIFDSPFAANVKILNGAESQVHDENIGWPQNGAISGHWKIPDGQSGGDYKIKVKFWAEGFPPVEKKFNIREFSTPRLKMQLEFVKKGYGPGDEAKAKLQVSRAEGGIPEKANVTSVARIDGEEVFRTTQDLGGDGKCEIKFNLPPSIEAGEGTLNCTMNDEGTIETTSATIPILLQKIDMNFYPEGGDLIAGLECGVYVEAFTPVGDPADFTAEIIDAEIKEKVGLLQTLHEGRGRGSFTPEKGRKYGVRVLEPSGVKFENALPEIKDSGVSLSAKQHVYTSSQPITLQVGSTETGSHRIVISKKQVAIVETEIFISSPNDVENVSMTLPQTGNVDGVLRVTVYNQDGVAKAERLVFRKPKNMLNLSIVTDKENYTPGDTVSLSIDALDERGVPVPAFVGVCVTDDSVLEMEEKRKQAPRLAVQAFLENEVDHLEDAHVYLDPDHPKSDVGCDLLLGTQGWRRFAFESPKQFLQKYSKGEIEGKTVQVAQRLFVYHEKEESPKPKPQPREQPAGIELLAKGGRGRAEKFKKKSKKKAPMRLEKAAPVMEKKKLAAPVAKVPAKPKPAALVAKAPAKPKPAAPVAKAPAKPKPAAPVAMKEEAKAMNFKAVRAKRKKKMKARPRKPVVAQSPTILVIREFAHKKSANWKVGQRSDFTETVYWHASLSTENIVWGVPRGVKDGQNFCYELDGNWTKVSHLSDTNSPGKIWHSFSTLESVKKKKGEYVFEVRRGKSMAVKVGFAQRSFIDQHLDNDFVGCDGQSWSFHPRNGSGQKWHNKSGTTYGSWGKNPSGDAPVIRAILNFDKKKIRFEVDGKDLGDAFSSINTDGEIFPVVSMLQQDTIWVRLSRYSPKKLISFDLNDSITSFKIWVDGVSTNGMVGSKSKLLTSRNPFYLEYKLPIEVSGGDKMMIPCNLVNSTDKDLSVQLKGKTDDEGSALKLLSETKKDEWQVLGDLIKILQNSRKRGIFEAEALFDHKNVGVTVNGEADGFSDTVTRNMRVVPAGFPFQLNASGMMKANGEVTHQFSIPEGLVKGSVKTSVCFYLSPLSNMTQALKALVRQPYGCFEQTSSTSYPMVMAQQYFMSHRGVDSDIIKKAKDLIEKSYERLIGFEVKSGSKKTGGFDWFGSSPASESLTSYGLLQFKDMAQVFSGVESDLLSRTRDWLLSRREGNGAFKKGGRALDQFGSAPQDTTHVYICWALTSGGEKRQTLSKEIKHAISIAEKNKDDPYILALLTITLMNVGRIQDGKKWAYQLTELQTESGAVQGGGKGGKLHDSRYTSITCARGDSFLLESTSLAVFAWLKDAEEFRKFIERGIQFIASKCKNGRFGSTQATILALKAIVAYDAYKTKPKSGSVSVMLNKKEVAVVEFDPSKSTSLIELPSFADSIEGGKQYELSIRMKDGMELPYSCSVEFNALKPQSDEECPVKLTTKLSNDHVKEGEGSEIQVCMENKSKEEGQPMTIAVIGLPGGMEPRHTQLQELVKSGKIACYEVLGREVAIYLRQMTPGEKKKFKIDVVARIPGVYQAPASRIYLYYTDEWKHWCEPLSVTISPAQ